CLPPQDQGALAALPTAQRELRLATDLPTRVAVEGVRPLAEVVDDAARTKLLHGLDDVPESLHVPLGQQAPVRVHRDLPVQLVTTRADERAGLALLDQAKALHVEQGHARERVVELSDVDVSWRD